VPFLQALAKRKADLTGVEVLILGSGDALPACQSLVRDARLEGVVKFAGALPRPAMLAALAEAVIGVLPLWDNRLNRARFPLKMLDYLACGCAVAASDTGMARAVLRDGETALLSPPGDMDRLVENVLRLARDAALRDRLALNGRQLVQEYDEPAVCSRWQAALEQPAG
jgi:glycosyltransferase involved in cell wall biosynthesis